MPDNLRNETDKPALKAYLSNLANSICITTNLQKVL